MPTVSFKKEYFDELEEFYKTIPPMKSLNEFVQEITMYGLAYYKASSKEASGYVPIEEKADAMLRFRRPPRT